MPEAGPVIEARGLVRRFGAFTAVAGVDLAVAPGEVFALIGANGAGKTTTLRMLCGLLPPSAGRIRVAGVDMVRHPRRARAALGYLSQRFALYRELGVLENLRLQAGLYGLAGRERERRLAWALEALGLAEVARLPAAQLPLGYRRRLELAAALLHRPRVLFLDEPTSGVDPLARQAFWELLYSLAGEGMAMIVTTHYLDEAAYCERLAMMHAGRFIAEGDPEELVARPLPTPLLEVGGPGWREARPWLEGRPEVLEIVPHAGYLRLRLRPGRSPEAFLAALGRWAAAAGLAVEARPAAPTLEDVFVALLEAEAGKGEAA